MERNYFSFGKVVGKVRFCDRKEEIKVLTNYIFDTYSVWL